MGLEFGEVRKNHAFLFLCFDYFSQLSELFEVCGRLVSVDKELFLKMSEMKKIEGWCSCGDYREMK